jgi:hypothetical protein
MSEDLAERCLANFTAENRRKAPPRDEIYKFVIDAMESVLDGLVEDIKTLRKQVEQLEKSGARFRGVYQRPQAYRRGDQASHRGSLWVALGDVPEGSVPGENPAHWQLAAKGTG